MGNANKKEEVIGAVCFQNIEGEQEQELSFKKILTVCGCHTKSQLKYRGRRSPSAEKPAPG